MRHVIYAELTADEYALFTRLRDIEGGQDWQPLTISNLVRRSLRELAEANGLLDEASPLFTETRWSHPGAER